ncbi:beta/gamma crystallin-related protein [Rhodopila globiformis]|nr:beta/gamma crystallin-related protein [Rhodopila globiformis]
MAELIMFVDADFGGLHTHVFDSTADFTKLALGGVGTNVNGTWNDVLSSFVIVSGHWAFFKDINFQFQQGEVLGPGRYSFVQNFGIDNDAVSSVRLVSS